MRGIVGTLRLRSRHREENRELAIRRCELASILQRLGADGLIAELNRKADLLSATVASAS
jgi:hypothetical protein